MNILITGCNGQLGTEMRLLSESHPLHTYFFTDVQDLDIAKREDVHNFVNEHKIDLIVNCAAYTNVDKAEEDEETASLVNAKAVENLGLSGAKIIHVSTDYVFSGNEHTPCKEEDEVAPNTVYGRTKLEGEQLLLTACPNAIIIRTAWLYSPFGNNFVKTMLKYGEEKDELNVVFDQIGTPTYAADLAEAIFSAIESPEWHPGIYHFTNEGVCSWYDFTIAILDFAGITCKVNPILSSEYKYKTPRPHYSVLNKNKIKQTFGINIPYWMRSLANCIERMK